MTRRGRPPLQGAIYGLSAAILFGAGMPLAKALLGQIQPFVLAGLFYLGSGIGLSCWLLTSKRWSAVERQAPLSRADWPWLAAAVLFGGVFAGLLLMWGLTHTPASQASLLLNLEGVFGAAIAWVIFHEHANRRVVLGMILLTLGAMILSLGPNMSFLFSWPALCVIGACLCWAIDNNLTRKISAADPVQIAAIKGLVAGTVNIFLGLSLGAALPVPALAAASMTVGLLSYGISLVLYILGLRHVGTARTAAYFSAAPFIGALASIGFLHEPISLSLCVAAVCMAGGLYLHLSETHEHEHTHEPMEHAHSHTHDEHHQHDHGTDDPQEEPHSHHHRHERITHTHPHMPEIHHQHSH